MKLPFDVLVAIMAVTSSRSALSAMTTTCRMLNHAGAKYLAMDGVALRGRQLRSFLLFILAQEETRVRYLRKLDIQFEDDSPEKPHNDVPPLGSVAEYLRDMKEELVQDDLYLLLSRPSLSLDTLILRGSEQATFRNVRAGRAIRNLRTLKHLTLLYSETLHASVHPEIFSQLTSATFSMCQSIRSGPAGIAFLRHSRNTLQKLSIHNDPCLTRDIVLLHTIYIKAFPTLREFSILGVHGSNHPLSFRLCRHAPIDGRDWSLHVSGLPDRFPTPETDHRVWIFTTRYRERNIHYQIALGADIWPPLAAYVGNIPSLYRLGLVTDVPVLRLCTYESTRENAEMVSAMMMEYFRPSRLCIRAPSVRQLRGTYSIPELVLTLGIVHSIEVEVILDSDQCKKLPATNLSDSVSILVRVYISAIHGSAAH